MSRRLTPSCLTATSSAADPVWRVPESWTRLEALVKADQRAFHPLLPALDVGEICRSTSSLAYQYLKVRRATNSTVGAPQCRCSHSFAPWYLGQLTTAGHTPASKNPSYDGVLFSVVCFACCLTTSELTHTVRNDNRPRRVSPNSDRRRFYTYRPTNG